MSCKHDNIICNTCGAGLNAAIADARAAGYAEAIEKAAKILCEYPKDDALDRIRALAPATTEEPK